MARIQKMLKLAQHPNTSEAEARQALRASTRMLSAVNLTEAEVMADESQAEQLQRAGHSIVTVRHREGKTVSLERWSVTLGHAINVAFNVKYFYTRYSSHDRIEFTFYGLRDNTVAAAISFEAVFNLALAWAAGRGDVKGRTGKNSYLLGLAESLYRMTSKEKKQEEKQAIEAEKRTLTAEEEICQSRTHARDDHLAGSDEKPNAGDPLPESKAAGVSEEEDDDDVQFVSLKPGRAKPSSDVYVKKESLDSDDDQDLRMSPNLQSSRDADSADNDDEIEEDIGDLDTERQRFDAAYENQPRPPVLGERDRNAVKEEAQEEADVKPNVQPKLEPWSDLDISGDQVGLTANDATAPVKAEAGIAEADMPTWHSRAQLVLFKETAARLADEYLKTISAKVRHSKAQPKQSMRDQNAYRKGAEDARKVDLKRRRLEAD